MLCCLSVVLCKPVFKDVFRGHQEVGWSVGLMDGGRDGRSVDQVSWVGGGF